MNIVQKYSFKDFTDVGGQRDASCSSMGQTSPFWTFWNGDDIIVSETFRDIPGREDTGK